MRIQTYFAIKNAKTGNFFKTYRENGVDKESWTKLFEFATLYSTIGSTNYEIRQHQTFFENEYLIIETVKLILKR